MKIIDFKKQTLAGGSTQIVLRLFGLRCWTSLHFNYGYLFRLFGVGLTRVHNNQKPLFIERIGKRKSITIGNYRYKFLKPHIL